MKGLRHDGQGSASAAALRRLCLLHSFTQLKLHLPSPKQSFLIASKPLFPVSAVLGSGTQPLPSPLPSPPVLLQVLQPSLRKGLTPAAHPLYSFFFCNSKHLADQMFFQQTSSFRSCRLILLKAVERSLLYNPRSVFLQKGQNRRKSLNA